jgi:hypothetical protein
MKQIISKTSPSRTVYPDEVSGRNFIGLTASGGKYVLNPNAGGGVAFSSGTSCWQTYTSKEKAIDASLEDDRCTLYAFDNLIELANWLKK